MTAATTSAARALAVVREIQKKTLRTAMASTAHPSCEWGQSQPSRYPRISGPIRSRVGFVQ